MVFPSGAIFKLFKFVGLYERVFSGIFSKEITDTNGSSSFFLFDKIALVKLY